MKRIFVTSKLPGNFLDPLTHDFIVEVCKEVGNPTQKEISDGVESAHAIISTVSDQIDKNIIDAGENLVIVSNYGVGYDNIDIPYATQKGIFVTNTPGVLTETTADLVWALMLAVSRRIVEGDSYVREGRFQGWNLTLLLGLNIYGKTLGIYGLGRIGRAVARRATGFNMRVIYNNRNRYVEAERETGGTYVDFPTLLKESHFLIITAPLNSETRGRFGLGEFKKMRSDAVLVNTGRGPIIRERELAKALREKIIWGAGLDVYEREPEVETELLSLENVVLLPHLGSATRETREKMSEMAVENVRLALSGKVPINLVNPEVLKIRT